MCRLKLLASTTGLVPRDTYSSYITHNPTDALRTFTGDQSEVGFIRQHQKSDEAIKPAVDRMLLLQEEPYREDRFDLLRSVISSLKVLKEENAAVHKRVDPIFFMTCFRNYRIDPLNLDTSYLNFRLFSKFLVFSWQEDKILLPYTRTSLMINDSVCAFL
ncbi:monodechloroaminopyrrolnitrin synthase PrnB family protein [Geobacillus thermodenitrificans]|uniref:monodechloroaminopyrrolnitrin synthase PrnB family protein n=1 Tax=Geobacillus thermodenitrificans TaxID=33940 RepID=UPI003455F22C